MHDILGVDAGWRPNQVPALVGGQPILPIIFVEELQCNARQCSATKSAPQCIGHSGGEGLQNTRPPQCTNRVHQHMRQPPCFWIEMEYRDGSLRRLGLQSCWEAQDMSRVEPTRIN